MSKPKHRVEVEKLIHRGYKTGMCDLYGNSVTLPDGRFVRKPRVRGVVRLHKVYRRYEDS